MINHTVIIEEKGFWRLRFWKIWDTLDPSWVETGWSKKKTIEIARSFAGNTGDIAVRVGNKLTRIFDLN